jgi:hypothetical protein
MAHAQVAVAVVEASEHSSRRSTHWRLRPSKNIEMPEEEPADAGHYDDDEPVDSVWELYSTRIITSMSVAVLAGGTIVYRVLEDWSWVDSLYFSVITLTTVGYGDLTPSSSASKLFTVFYLVTGISLLGAALNEVLKRRGRQMAARRARRHRGR